MPAAVAHRIFDEVDIPTTWLHATVLLTDIVDFAARARRLEAQGRGALRAFQDRHIAALPLLAMALVIQFVVGAADPAFWQTEHDYWMLLLGVLITKGAGRLSLDALLARRSGVGL
jgi:hypothetical protein